MFSLFFFLVSLNYKVASQLILKWKVYTLALLVNSERVLKSPVPSSLSAAEEELLIFISDAILIFMANKLLVQQQPLQS